MIERDSQGNKTATSRAALAVMAMEKEPMADQVERLERKYWDWLGLSINDDGAVIGKKWHTSWRTKLLASLPPVTFFRNQVELLAGGYSSLKRAVRNNEINGGFYAEYSRLVEQNRGLRSFLYRHYRTDLDRADSLGTPLIDVVKVILLRPTSGLAAVAMPDSLPQNESEPHNESPAA